MDKLPIPLKDESLETIYKTCANGFTDEEKKGRILSYLKEAVSVSETYFKYIPHNIASFLENTAVEDDKKEVMDLYDKKFSVKQFHAGRTYYDKIISHSRGQCAICGIGRATTLDHYLPKTKYPLLCVTPANLVPQCQDCNKNKGTYYVEKEEGMLIHPYFDDFSKIRWLEVNLKFGKEIEYRYYNAYTKDMTSSERLSTTLEKYQLAKLYAVQANNLVKNNQMVWKRTLEKSGEKGLKECFIETKDSYEDVDVNSWLSALYRAIIKQIKEMIGWLLAP